MSDISNQINSYLAVTAEAANRLSLTANEVRETLLVVLDVDKQVSLLDRNLNTEEIVSLLANFYFTKPTLQTSRAKR
jgi:hypothetical protein